jgi:CBS domain-containing protein
MTTDVICVQPEDSIQRAARAMRECDCGSLPVVDRFGRLIGVITDRDITVRLVARGVDTRQAVVEDAMTDDIVACNVNDSTESCLRMMARHQVRRLPVVDYRDRVVGIVSQGDLARHAGDHSGRGERRAVADALYKISEPARVS